MVFLVGVLVGFLIVSFPLFVGWLDDRQARNQRRHEFLCVLDSFEEAHALGIPWKDPR